MNKRYKTNFNLSFNKTLINLHAPSHSHIHSFSVREQSAMNAHTGGNMQTPSATVLVHIAIHVLRCTTDCQRTVDSIHAYI